MDVINNRIIKVLIVIILFWGKNAFCENTYHLVRTIKIDYGQSDSHLSFINTGTSQPNVSEFFSNDSKGNFYVCDALSNKILTYSKNGIFIKSIRFSGDISPADIIIDKSDNIFIYDVIQSKVYQINTQGKLIKSFSFNPEQLSSRGVLHIAEQKLYIVDSNQRSLKIADLSNEKMTLVKQSTSNPTITTGIPAEMNRKYIVSLKRGEEGIINIIDKTTQIVSFKLGGIVSIRFVKEDQHRNFYIQTERIQKNCVILDIHTFSYDGQLLNSFTIPDNHYPYWTSKLLSIDNNGNVWQFIPEVQFARINIFNKK